MKYMTKNIKFNTAMLKQSLFNYSDAYILVKGTITAVRYGYIKVFSSKINGKKFFSILQFIKHKTLHYRSHFLNK